MAYARFIDVNGRPVQLDLDMLVDLQFGGQKVAGDVLPDETIKLPAALGGQLALRSRSEFKRRFDRIGVRSGRARR